MKIKFLSALFGTKKADTTEAVETITANVQTVASSEPAKNENETVLFTTEAVAKMTPAEALAKLQNQLTEKKVSIFEKATTTEKIKKELEKATKKATDNWRSRNNPSLYEWEPISTSYAKDYKPYVLSDEIIAHEQEFYERAKEKKISKNQK